MINVAKRNKIGTPYPLRRPPLTSACTIKESGDASFRSLLTPHSAWMMFGRFLPITGWNRQSTFQAVPKLFSQYPYGLVCHCPNQFFDLRFSC
jgi:hypothetical protein